MSPTLSTANQKRVLFVSYLFPPTGGVGVLRATKFVKYLPEFGWDVTVLTAENPSVPLRDESLLAEIPPETIIRTARTFEPGYAVKSMVAGSSKQPVGMISRIKRGLKQIVKRFVNLLLQPDTAILWSPRAVREGLQLLREEHHDAIIVSAPPFSSLLVGAALSRKTGVPLVVDYRDEWSISNAYWENKQQGRLGNWGQRKMQNYVLRTAQAIVATTPGSARALGQIANNAGSDAKATHIYNGFDPSDFPSPHNRPSRVDYGNGIDRLRLAFVGTLWTLTSIEPFVKALQQLADAEPTLLDRLEIVFAGRQVGDEITYLKTLESLPCHVVNVGFLDHADALRLMATSDWLLQLLSDRPNVERVIASKLFEYMGARRPILAITCQGDHWDVVSQLPDASVFLPSDTEGIAATVAARLLTHEPGDLPDMAKWDVALFERRHLTGELARLLDRVAGTAPEAHMEATAKQQCLPVDKQRLPTEKGHPVG